VRGYFLSVRCSWVAIVAREGASTGGLAPVRRKCDRPLGQPLGFRLFFEMEISFTVESKTFVFSVLEGASTMRVGEKRKSFSGVIFISPSCSEWLASTLESLVGVPEDQAFIKSFREGSRVLIARRGRNQAGRFLEAASFGMGGRKGFILIPEGRGGWGWIKFSEELRKSAALFSASVGGENGSLHDLVENKGKEVEVWPGLVPFSKGPSFVEVLKAGSVDVVKKGPVMGGNSSGSKVVPVVHCEPDFLPAARVLDADLRTALDCSTLEPFDPLGKDHHRCPLGKSYRPRASLKFEISKLRTWSKRVIGFNMALGRAVNKLLGRLARNGLCRKGLRLGCFMPKPSSSRSSLPETTSVDSSGLCNLVSSEMVVPSGDLLSGDCSEPATAFVFPLPSADLPSPATSVLPASSGSLSGEKLSGFPSLSGATELGKKLQSSSSPFLLSSPFKYYYRRAREIRAGQKVVWNDGLLADSLVASKLSADPIPFKETGGESRAKKKIQTPANQGLFKKGFLNLPPIVSVPHVLPREVKDVGAVGLSSPLSGCIFPCSIEGNGISQSQRWPIDSDHNGEIVVWEEEEEDYWDGLPLDWALEGAFGEEALAIRDAMEEEFQREKMIARQKSKGKRELLNLHSSINYGDEKNHSRRRNGKAHL
jgi:hypothetical protein